MSLEQISMFSANMIRLTKRWRREKLHFAFTSVIIMNNNNDNNNNNNNNDNNNNNNNHAFA